MSGKKNENFTRIGGLAALATLDFARSDVLEVTESVPGFHFGTGANSDAILWPRTERSEPVRTHSFNCDENGQKQDDESERRSHGLENAHHSANFMAF